MFNPLPLLAVYLRKLNRKNSQALHTFKFHHTKKTKSTQSESEGERLCVIFRDIHHVDYFTFIVSHYATIICEANPQLPKDVNHSAAIICEVSPQLPKEWKPLFYNNM